MKLPRNIICAHCGRAHDTSLIVTCHARGSLFRGERLCLGCNDQQRDLKRGALPAVRAVLARRERAK